MTPTQPVPPRAPALAACVPAPVAVVAAGRGARLRVVGPLLLLLAEVCALTPWVEFSDGPFQHFASARVCAGALLALVAILFLTVGRRGPAAARRPATALPWLAAGLAGACGGRVRTLRLALPLRTALLYLLNAARIDGLVVVGTAFSRELCVRLAHSRVAAALFLAVTAGALSLTPRPGRPPALPAGAEGGAG